MNNANLKKKSKRLSFGEDKWKPVLIKDDWDSAEFEGLVGIEELTNYDEGNVKSIKKDRKTCKKGTTDDSDQTAKSERKKSTKKKKKKVRVIDKNENKVRDKSQVFSKVDNFNSCQIPPNDSQEDIDEINMKQTAQNACNIKAWKKLFVPETVISALKELHFSEPTPIQSESIPIAIRDRMDIVGAAETGSGKTLAFAIPLIHFIKKEKNEERKTDTITQKLRALIITPTRELALQIKKHIEAVSKYSNVSVDIIVGGMSSQKQERVLCRFKPDILVATPGRLWELIESERIAYLNTELLSQLRYLVIDEADRMTEQGHFEELRRIINVLNLHGAVDERQIFVFSATLTLKNEPEKKLRKKSKGMMPRQQKVSLLIEMLGMKRSKTKVIDLTRKGIGTPSEELLTETKINCLETEKDLYLYYFLILNPGRTLVFCNSKSCLRRLVNVMKLLNLSPLSLHADMPQKKRFANLEKFSTLPNSLLIASDVAARGLDIANIDHVVHYQIPRNAEIYIHRSGRTARARHKGLSLMLCDPKEETQFYNKLCQKLNKGCDLQDFDIDHNILKKTRERVALAQKCDQLEHSLRKTNADSNWFRKNAKECDIDLDEDLKYSDDESAENLKAQRNLKALMLQLKASLKRPCGVQRFVEENALGSKKQTKESKISAILIARPLL